MSRSISVGQGDTRLRRHETVHRRLDEMPVMPRRSRSAGNWSPFVFSLLSVAPAVGTVDRGRTVCWVPLGGGDSSRASTPCC